MVSIDGPAVDSSLEDSLRSALLSREAITLYDLAKRLRVEACNLKDLLDEWIVSEKVECLFPVLDRIAQNAAHETRDSVFYRWKREHDTSQLWQLKYTRNRAPLPRSTDHRAFLY